MALSSINASQGQDRPWSNGHPTWDMRHRLQKRRESREQNFQTEPIYTAKGVLLPISSLEITV